MAAHDTTKQNIKLKYKLNSFKKNLLVDQEWMRSHPSRMLGHR